MSNHLQRSFKIRKSSKKPNYEDTEQDKKQVMNLNDLHLTNQIKSTKHQDIKQTAYRESSIAPKILNRQYDGSEDNIACYRFPHMSFCGCETNCLYTSSQIYQISPQLFVCGFQSGTKTRHLLQHGITHILNLTSKQYTKRTQYFEYLNIDIHNNSEEDIKKFFRMTNRFIKSNIEEVGGVNLIHSASVALSACFALSYLIGVKRIPMKGSMQIIRRSIPNLEIPAHFMKQLENYDLQKLAFVTIKRQK